MAGRRRRISRSGINGIESHQRESTFLMQLSRRAAQGRPVQIWILNKTAPTRTPGQNRRAYSYIAVERPLGTGVGRLPHPGIGLG
jgi:hypothetical protein